LSFAQLKIHRIKRRLKSTLTDRILNVTVNVLLWFSSPFMLCFSYFQGYGVNWLTSAQVIDALLNQSVKWIQRTERSSVTVHLVSLESTVRWTLMNVVEVGCIFNNIFVYGIFEHPTIYLFTEYSNTRLFLSATNLHYC